MLLQMSGRYCTHSLRHSSFIWHRTSIRGGSAPWQKPGRIEDEGQLGRDVNKGSQQWVEKSNGCQAHSDRVDGERTHKVLQDDATTSPGNTQSFYQFREVAADQNDIATFAGHGSPRSHGDTNVGFNQGGGVIDAVADHRDFAILTAQL